MTKLGVGPALPVDPVAHAGADQSASKARPVTLDGSASVDPDCDPLTLSLGADRAVPPSCCPIPPRRSQLHRARVASGGATLTFRLTSTTASTPARRTPWTSRSSNVNQPPVADAGADQTVREGSTVTLHGGDSFDPDGDPLTYLLDPDRGTGRLAVRPLRRQPHLHRAAGGGDAWVYAPRGRRWPIRSPADVHGRRPDRRHLRQPGPDRAGGVRPDGRRRDAGDPAGHGQQRSRRQPADLRVDAGRAVRRSCCPTPASPTPTFTAPAVGSGGATLVFQLVVSDGSSASAPDAVTVTVRDLNQAPSCALARPSVERPLAAQPQAGAGRDRRAWPTPRTTASRSRSPA